jgi:hypothetical protein
MAPLPVLSRRKFLQATALGGILVPQLNDSALGRSVLAAIRLRLCRNLVMATRRRVQRAGAWNPHAVLPFTEIGDQQYATYVRVS